MYFLRASDDSGKDEKDAPGDGKAGAVQGFLIHRSGRLWALSRICTHMGCLLRINQAEGVFACPCHGAEFDLQGTIHNAHEYGRVLPPLPRIKTRVNGETVEVFGA